jgi:hypothetical protein
MTDLCQVLALMAAPAGVLLVFRYLNLRDARTAPGLTDTFGEGPECEGGKVL